MSASDQLKTSEFNATRKLTPPKNIIGGIPTDRVSQEQLSSLMVEDCLSARAAAGGLLPKLVFASNGSVIARYHSDRAYRDLMDQADIIDADGAPLVLISRLLCSSPLPERVATTDFIHTAAADASEHGLKFFFLGGKEEDSLKATEFFAQSYPGLQISGRRNGYFSAADETDLCDLIVKSGTDVLWLGLGSPLQEHFAVRNRERLRGLGWIRTCGGMFDYYSGRNRRAPLWMQRAGLEWLFRTWLEPTRLGPRYLKTNVPALYHLLTKTERHSAAVPSKV